MTKIYFMGLEKMSAATSCFWDLDSNLVFLRVGKFFYKSYPVTLKVVLEKDLIKATIGRLF